MNILQIDIFSDTLLPQILFACWWNKEKHSIFISNTWFFKDDKTWMHFLESLI